MAHSGVNRSGPDSETVRGLVAEVLRRVQVEFPAAGTGPTARPPEPPAAVPATPTPATAVRLTGGVVTLAMVERLPAGTRRLVVDAAAVVTPSARDHARDLGIAIDRAGDAASRRFQAPFFVAHAECGVDGTARAAAIARGVAGASQLPATGLADVVASLATHASHDAARGVLLTGKPALATTLANRSASLRAVTARDPVALAAAAAECNANLLVVDPANFPQAAFARLAQQLATRPAGQTPPLLAARPAGCGCKTH